MATRDIPGRIKDWTYAAEGLITLTVFDEDPGLYNSRAIGDVVDKTGLPGQHVESIGSTLMRLMDIPILRDSDDGPGFYAGVRGVLSNWGGAIVFESDDDTADFKKIKTFDTPAVFGFTRGVLPSVSNTNTWDYTSSLKLELIGGSLESMDEDEALKGLVGYLIGRELVLCPNVEQISGNVWQLNPPFVRGWRGTECEVGTHAVDETFVVLTQDTIQRINDELSDLNKERMFKAVTSGMSLDSAQIKKFTDTGVSLMPWSVVDIEGVFDGSNNIIITWKRRSRIFGRNGRDFFDPPLGEDTEAYEIDILSDDEKTVKRTLNATSETVTYTIADQTTDFGGAKEHNLHVKIYQMSAQVGRGHCPGVAVLDPIGFSESAPLDMQFEDGSPMDFEDDSRMEFEGA